MASPKKVLNIPQVHEVVAKSSLFGDQPVGNDCFRVLDNFGKIIATVMHDKAQLQASFPLNN